LNTNNSDLADNAIHDITGYDGKIYIATNNGVCMIDSSSGKLDNFTEYYTTKDGLPDNKIRCVKLDSNKNLWIGTAKGLALLNTKTKKIENLNYILEDANIPNAFIKTIYEDSAGEIYIGGFSEEGLVRYNPKTKSVRIYKHDESKNSISNDSIRYITEDSKNNLFIGTSYGLNILDKNREKFTSYTNKDGLANNTVYCVLLDDEDNAWLSTNYGLSKFNTSSKIFENFTTCDGIQSNEFNGQSAFKDIDGLLYFGGARGLNIFNPKEIKTTSFVPSIIFDRLKVKGLDSPILKNNKFKYESNNIEISYFINDYKNTKAVNYYYKLDGLNGINEDWNLITNNSIFFAYLKPGNYTFKIKARSYNGVFSKEKKINFEIQPPFWRSKIALFIYVLIILTYIYLSINKVKRLDKLVYNKTKELHHQMDENKRLYEKVLELEVNKNYYLINLSHELRTPLNVLNSISQVFKNSIDSHKTIPYDKLTNYSEIIERNCNRLLGLINNIIDNSKLQNNDYILNKEYQDIVYIVEEAVLSMKNFVEEKGIELIIDTDTEEKEIYCDKIEIERCIINLVSNAAKHTNPGGSIEVFIYDLNDKVKIVVKDTGIGISKENQKHIFDRFNQVVDKNSERKGGSGLGLTIVKQLIELHDGNISLKSKLGVGSEFTIVLPRD
ncbi:MAG: ATP-binding protein, partial [bacterium]|nr:ATP-binding protein [bacterium]